MKQQVIFLKGGIPKENYTSYYNYLEGIDFDPYEETRKNRNRFLGENLGTEYEYHVIPFPERYYADYEAWEIIFEKMIPFMYDEIIIVATSLGGAFITRYLSANTLPIVIKKLIMLAPAMYDAHEKLGTFLPDLKKSHQMNTQCKEIIIYHSFDDDLVPFSDSQRYLEHFPDAIFREFSNKGHFYNETRIFELEEDIKN